MLKYQKITIMPKSKRNKYVSIAALVVGFLYSWGSIVLPVFIRTVSPFLGSCEDKETAMSILVNHAFDQKVGISGCSFVYNAKGKSSNDTIILDYYSNLGVSFMGGLRLNSTKILTVNHLAVGRPQIMRFQTDIETRTIVHDNNLSQMCLCQASVSNDANVHMMYSCKMTRMRKELIPGVLNDLIYIYAAVDDNYLEMTTTVFSRGTEVYEKRQNVCHIEKSSIEINDNQKLFMFIPYFMQCKRSDGLLELFVWTNLIICTINPLVYFWLSMHLFYKKGIVSAYAPINSLYGSRGIYMAGMSTLIMLPLNVFHAFYENWTLTTTFGYIVLALDIVTVALVVLKCMGLLLNRRFGVTAISFLSPLCMYYYFTYYDNFFRVLVGSESSHRGQGHIQVRLPYFKGNLLYLIIQNLCSRVIFIIIVNVIAEIVYQAIRDKINSRIMNFNNDGCAAISSVSLNNGVVSAKGPLPSKNKAALLCRTHFDSATVTTEYDYSGLYVGAKPYRVIRGLSFSSSNAIVFHNYIIINEKYLTKLDFSLMYCYVKSTLIQKMKKLKGIENYKEHHVNARNKFFWEIDGFQINQNCVKGVHIFGPSWNVKPLA